MSPISAWTGGFMLFGIAGMAGTGIMGGGATSARRRLAMFALVVGLIFVSLLLVRWLYAGASQVADAVSYGFLVLGIVVVLWVFWRRSKSEKAVVGLTPRNQILMSWFIVAFVLALTLFGNQ